MANVRQLGKTKLTRWPMDGDDNDGYKQYGIDNTFPLRPVGPNNTHIKNLQCMGLAWSGDNNFKRTQIDTC